MDIITDPEKIQEKSLKIIDSVLSGLKMSEEERDIVYRIVHATGDFDISEVTVISSGAVEAGRKALQRGAKIITDVNMLKAGISLKKTGKWNYVVNCHINDEDVRDEAERQGITRSMMSMRKAAKTPGEKIFVIGNAPTALVELIKLIREEKVEPALVIGTPVGLVGAREAKRELEKLPIPHITIRGKKGGTAAAAAAANALIYL